MPSAAGATCRPNSIRSTNTSLRCPVPELDLDNEYVAEARRFYCGTIGVEFMHIPSRERREWIAAASRRSGLRPSTRTTSSQLLTRADIFEQVIQSRYLGTKRFSLEGVTALIPFLDELLNRSAELGAERAIMGMSHRGRLSVMVNTFGKSPVDIFARFEDVDPRSILGGGDVKYHVGATGDIRRPQRQQRRAASRLEPQPSRSRRSRRHGPRPRPSGSLSALTASTASCPSSSTATPPSPARASGPKP